MSRTKLNLNTEVTQMLKVLDNDFKDAIIKMFQGTITNMSETNKIERVSKN